MVLTRYERTANKIIDRLRYLISAYFHDMRDFSGIDEQRFFDFLSRKIHYIPDPPGQELFMRPSILLQRGGGDCDDKTIAACSYFKCRNIPVKMVFVSESVKKPIHHIFCMYFKNGEWKDFDATYPTNLLNDKIPWPIRKELEV